MEFLIYGDINMGYLIERKEKKRKEGGEKNKKKEKKNWPQCQEHTICCTQLILQ